MRTHWLKDGVRQARATLREASYLARDWGKTTLLLTAVLALLPSALCAALSVAGDRRLIRVLEVWLSGDSGLAATALVQEALRGMRMDSFWLTLLDLCKSLLFTPLLLSSLALVYNGFIDRADACPALSAARQAGRGVKQLAVVALCCMLAEWLAQMLPSIASGFINAVAGLLSIIPFLGTLAYWLAVLLTLLVGALTDFAVSVAFCYVWISAACEGVGGFSALARSWTLTRGAMRQTVSALLGLLVVKWVTVAVGVLICLLLCRFAGMPVTVLVYLVYLLNGLYTAALGAVASALYRRRPIAGGWGGPDLSRMKRANLD